MRKAVPEGWNFNVQKTGKVQILNPLHPLPLGPAIALVGGAAVDVPGAAGVAGGGYVVDDNELGLTRPDK